LSHRTRNRGTLFYFTAGFPVPVLNPTINEANRLATQYCLASKFLGLLIFKAGIQAPSFLGSVQGLTIEDEDDHNSVLHLVAETYLHGPVGTIIHEISSHNPNEQPPASDEERVFTILQTLTGCKIEMNTSTGSKCVNFNLYMHSPTNDDNDWACLLESVNKTIYRHPLLGSSYHGPQWSCNVCHSVDHPTGLCLFPLIPGWIKADGYKPISDFRHGAAQEISRGAEAERVRRREHARGRGVQTPRGRGSARN